MRKASRFYTVLLLWLAANCTILRAQSRVGGGNGQTVDPTLLPVQNYVVVDLGATASTIALDDQGDVAFGNLSPDYPAAAVVQTFSQGVASTAVTYPVEVDTSSVDQSYSFFSLLPSGTIEGLVGQSFPNAPDTNGNVFGCLLCPNANPASGASPFIESDLGVPAPFSDQNDPDGMMTQYSSVSPNGLNYIEFFKYDAIAIPGGGTYKWSSYATILLANGMTTFFAYDAPSFLVNTSTTTYISEWVGGGSVNDGGWAVLSYGDIGPFVWYNGVMYLGGLPDGSNGIFLQLNNQGWCLVGSLADDASVSTPGSAGAVWQAAAGENGQATLFTDLLIGTPWESQLTNVHPQLLSNQNAVDQSMYAVTDLLDNQQEEEVVWKATTTPVTPPAVRTWTWQPYRIQIPAGTTINVGAYVSINSSGVIAAFGNSGQGSNHALLLYPVSFVQPVTSQSSSNTSSSTNNSNTSAAANTSPTIVGANLKPINSYLRVAKLDNSFADGAMGGADPAGLIANAPNMVASNGPTWLIADPDCFYIQMAVAANSPAMTVMLSTVNTTGYTQYNEKPQAIVLNPVKGSPGLLRSKPLILVSDTVDYTQLTSSAAGGAQGQVHLIALGGTVIVTYQPPAPANAKLQTIAIAKVRVEHAIPLNITVFNSAVGTPCMNAAGVGAFVSYANERFAQVGIQFTANIRQGTATDSRYDLFGGLAYASKGDEATPGGDTSALQKLLDAFGTPSTKDICVFFVPWLGTIGGTNVGTSTPLASGWAAAEANNCVITATALPPFTLAHELGHIIGNLGHDEQAWHLMRGTGTSNSNLYYGSKRFSLGEYNQMQNNPDGAY